MKKRARTFEGSGGDLNRDQRMSRLSRQPHGAQIRVVQTTNAVLRTPKKPGRPRKQMRTRQRQSEAWIFTLPLPVFRALGQAGGITTGVLITTQQWGLATFAAAVTGTFIWTFSRDYQE